MLRKIALCSIILLVMCSCTGEKKNKVADKPTPSAHSYGSFSMDKWQGRIPYGTLTYFRISDTLNSTNPISGQDYYDLFQETTTPSHGPGECGCGRTIQLFPGKESLLNYQGRFRVNPNCNDSVDMITVLSNYKDTIRIYMLTYVSRNDTDDLGRRLNKGELMLFNLPTILSEKWKNDTCSFESYSEFLDTSVIKRTSVWRSNAGICKDSMIEIIRMTWFNDMFEGVDQARWKNGISYYDWMNPEAYPVWWRDPALKPKSTH